MTDNNAQKKQWEYKKELLSSIYIFLFLGGVSAIFTIIIFGYSRKLAGHIGDCSTLYIIISISLIYFLRKKYNNVWDSPNFIGSKSFLGMKVLFKSVVYVIGYKFVFLAKGLL